MRHDAVISRFLGRAFHLLDVPTNERIRIAGQLPRIGEELPLVVEMFVRDARERLGDLAN
jgi:hypothetical protein